MTQRRKSLLPLLILFVGFFFLGQIGVVEFSIWLVLVAVWVAVFTFWGRGEPKHPRTE